MLFLLLRILTISISKDIVSYKDQRKDNKYKYKPCDRKDFMSMKNPLTPAGIEPATLRFVTQHLKCTPL